MPDSRTLHTGDGLTATFSVSFPYLSRSHVSATVDGSAATISGWVDDSNVTLSAIPADGASVQIIRTTPDGLTSYSAGSVLPESDLNVTVLAAQYQTEEAYDRLTVNPVFAAQVDTYEFPFEYSATYASAVSFVVASTPTDFLGNKVLEAGRRISVSGATTGTLVGTIESALEGGGQTLVTVAIDDLTPLLNETLTVRPSVLSSGATGFPHVVDRGQGALYAIGTQGGAKHGTVFSGTYTPGTDQHFTLAAKAFTGTRTDVGSAPGSDHVVAVYGEAQRGAGSSDGVWGANTVTEAYNLNGPTIGIEVDVNNFSSDPGLSPAQAFIGLSVVNGATGRGGTAIATDRNGSYSNNEWNRGLHIKETLLRGIEFSNNGNATGIFSDTVLKIKSLSDATTTAALQLIPFDDTAPSTEILFYTTNSADSVITSKLMKRGAWHLGSNLNAALAGMVNAAQGADGEDTITLQRFTDTSPTGQFLRVVNAANSANLAKIMVDGRFVMGTPDSAIADGTLDPSTVSFYLNEAGNALEVRAKYADGVTLRTGSIALT